VLRGCCPLARPVIDMTQTKRPSLVLIVEDNEDNRIIYRAVLEHAGHTVIEAEDGQLGIDLARRERPDVIVMDISIPIVDGWEATRTLKSDPDTRMMPIVVVTAHALATDRAKAFEVGCDAYLAKPLEPRLLVNEVERLIALRPL
jgi:two-component system cell cycle response regulator DivK